MYGTNGNLDTVKTAALIKRAPCLLAMPPCHARACTYTGNSKWLTMGTVLQSLRGTTVKCSRTQSLLGSSWQPSLCPAASPPSGLCLAATLCTLGLGAPALAYSMVSYRAALACSTCSRRLPSTRHCQDLPPLFRLLGNVALKGFRSAPLAPSCSAGVLMVCAGVLAWLATPADHLICFGRPCNQGGAWPAMLGRLHITSAL